MTDDLETEVDWIFLAVLAGVIANGAHDTWDALYRDAKNGAQVITALIIDDALADELDEVKKDFHG